MYARCTKIVSSPAPCHYAHLAAYSAHYNTPDFTEDDHWTVGRTVPQTGELVSVVPHMQDRLYYA